MTYRKSISIALALAVALPVVSAPVFAQPEAPEAPRPMGGGMMKKMGQKMGNMHLKHMFEMMDADGNGSISKAEFNDHRSAMFAATDEDGDGALSADEAKAHMKHMRESMRAQMHEEMGDMMEEMGDMEDHEGMMMLRHEDMPEPGEGERVIRRVMRDENGDEREIEIRVEVQTDEGGDGEMREQEHVIIMHDGDDEDGEPRVVRRFELHNGRPMDAMGGGMMMRMDVNRDGQISREEFDVAGHRQFRDMDADENGEVSEVEARFAQRDMMKDMMRGMRGGGGPHIMRRMMHHGPGKDAPKPDHHN